MESKNFPMKCVLLAFYIVALGPAVSLKLFASRVYVASYHVCPVNLIIFILVWFFFGDAVVLLRESYTFLYTFCTRFMFFLLI